VPPGEVAICSIWRTAWAVFGDSTRTPLTGVPGTTAGFFVIVSGGARVVRDGELLARLGPGDFFGELSVLDGQPRLAQVLADGPTTCLALATWDFEAVLLEEPRVTLAILRGVARRLRDLTDAHRH